MQGFRDNRGKPLRLFFGTRAEAEGELIRRSGERVRFGRLSEELPARERVAAAKAKEILAPFGKTILEAAEHFADYLKRTAKSTTVTKLRDEMLADKAADGCKPRHLQDLRHRLGRFAEDFGDRMISTIETREVDDWLRGLDAAPQTRRNFRAVLSNFFSTAVVKGYAVENPVAKTARPKMAARAPEVFSPLEMASLLANADSRIVPALAIAAFAGLRHAEIDRLDWNAINLESGLIEVRTAAAKSRTRRLVKIEPNLRRWLLPHSKPFGPVRHANEIDLLKDACTAARLRRWPNNGLRHSFASYHLEHFKDIAGLALQLGHTSTSTLFEHYREVVKPADAAAWWKIALVEAQHGKVVSFAEA